MLVWNVYFGDWNGQKIKTYNIFDHRSFIEDCQKNYKQNRGNRESFFEKMRTDLMYYYWSKCEWEVIISYWPSCDGSEIKIDVYDQIRLNWDRFCEYVWANKEEFKTTNVKKVQK